MTNSRKLLAMAVALALAPAAHAVKVPLPTEGATMNIVFTIQPQLLSNEHGSPSGNDWSTDLFNRRARLQINGDFGKYFSYVFQVDNPNFGKYGNYLTTATNRVYVQDAWFGWAPTGITGGTVVYLEAGILFVPVSRDTITSISNKPTIEGHPDLARGFNGGVANRSTGVGFRGWALDKKLGFRGGIYEGVQPTAADVGLNPNKNPQFAGFANFDIIGSEEGGWLYQSVYFAKDPVVSISVAGSYQSRALRVTKGVTDQAHANAALFVDYPLSEQQELGFIANGFRYWNGTGSKDTGLGIALDLGFRFQFIRPYVSFEYFNSDDCPSTGATAAQCAAVHTSDSRNFRAGLDFYVNKNANHVMVEFSANHGQSAWGPQAISAAAAGYVPLSLDPATPTGPRRAINNLLSSPSQKSVLVHWHVNF